MENKKALNSLNWKAESIKDGETKWLKVWLLFPKNWKRKAEAYLEPSRRSTMELFAKIKKHKISLQIRKERKYKFFSKMNLFNKFCLKNT